MAKKRKGRPPKSKIEKLEDVLSSEEVFDQDNFDSESQKDLGFNPSEVSFVDDNSDGKDQGNLDFDFSKLPIQIPIDSQEIEKRIGESIMRKVDEKINTMGQIIMELAKQNEIHGQILREIAKNPNLGNRGNMENIGNIENTQQQSPSFTLTPFLAPFMQIVTEVRKSIEGIVYLVQVGQQSGQLTSGKEVSNEKSDLSALMKTLQTSLDIFKEFRRIHKEFIDEVREEERIHKEFMDEVREREKLQYSKGYLKEVIQEDSQQSHLKV